MARVESKLIFKEGTCPVHSENWGIPDRLYDR
jgi:hypothetical protein